MTRKFFFSKPFFRGESSDLNQVLRETLVLLLWPEARPAEEIAFDFPSPNSYFLKRGEDFLWVEIFSSAFSLGDLAGYLKKSEEITKELASKVCGFLVAPDFETDLEEISRQLRMPIRAFRYGKAVSLEAAPLNVSSAKSFSLWLEEVTPFLGPEDFSQKGFQEEKYSSSASYEEIIPAWSPLSREELKEFIQLEIDAASFKPV